MTLAAEDPATMELPIIDVAIIASYPRVRGMQLHSLAAVLAYHCARCEQQRETTLVADDGDVLVCPRCYARPC